MNRMESPIAASPKKEVSILLDAPYYLDSNPDVCRYVDVIERQHFLQHGLGEHRVPVHPYFDPSWYRALLQTQHSTVAATLPVSLLYQHWRDHQEPSPRLPIPWVMCIDDSRNELLNESHRGLLNASPNPYHAMCLAALQSSVSFLHLARFVVYDGQDEAFLELLQCWSQQLNGMACPRTALTVIRHKFSPGAWRYVVDIANLLSPEYPYFLYTHADVMWCRDPVSVSVEIGDPDLVCRRRMEWNL